MSPALVASPYRTALWLNSAGLLVQAFLWLPAYAAERWQWLSRRMPEGASLFWLIGLACLATLFVNVVLLVAAQDYRECRPGPHKVLHRRRLLLYAGASLFWAWPALWFAWIFLKALLTP